MREPKVAPLLNWRRLHEQAIEFIKTGRYSPRGEFDLICQPVVLALSSVCSALSVP